MDHPHVVFTERRLVIGQLGVPVPPPVSVASQPSPATLASDSPGIVSIDSMGRLVAHRDGRTWVRAVGAEGSVLEVDVRAPASLAIVPPRIEVRPGASIPLALVDPSTGEPVPAAAAAWSSSAPGRVAVRDGIAYATDDLGVVTVTAQVGDARASGEIAVADPDLRLNVTPPRARLRVGEVLRFEASGDRGGIAAAWSSSDGRVLASLTAGLYQASSPGRAQACASALGRRSCSTVEVTP